MKTTTTTLNRMIALQKALRAHRLNESHLLILLLLRADGQMPIGEAASRLNLRGSNMSRLVRLLDELGFVERAINTQDWRSVVISITQAGAEVLAKIQGGD